MGLDRFLLVPRWLCRVLRDLIIVYGVGLCIVVLIGATAVELLREFCI